MENPKPKTERATKAAVIKAVSGEGIRNVSIEALKPFKRNARLHPQSQIDALSKGIKKFGFTIPVLVDGENTILAGHGRVIAAKQLGLTEVPTMQAPAEWDEATKRAYIIADNRITDLAKWDEELLTLEIKDLKRLDFPLANLGFEVPDLKRFLAEDIVYPAGIDEVDAEGQQAPAEDFNVAEDELAREGRDPLQAIPDDEKPRYHQLPPEDATRAIRASEERIPLAVLLSRSEHDKWEAWKVGNGFKTDKSAFASLMGWKQDNALSPQTVEAMNAGAQTA